MFSSDTAICELMQGCFHGDQEAIAEFYRRFKNLIYAAIHDWTRTYRGEVASPEDIKEVFPDALIAIMANNFAKIQRARDQNNISGLVFIIAVHAAGRYFRRKGEESDRFVDLDDPVNPEVDSVIDQLNRRERIAIVDEFLQGLPENLREVMRLRYEEGKRYRDIAEVTGETVNNIGVIISRVKQRMKKFLRERYGDENDI